MKTNYFFTSLIVLLVSFSGFAQVDVTLRLDMSNETVSTDGVHVAGSINGWSTDSTMLTQEGTSDIYSVTVQLNQGWHYYKFLNGNAWGTEESAGYPCAPSNGNRFLYINDSGMPVTLEPVPFSGCNADGTGFSFTLNVDMSSEGSIAGEGIHVAGWFTDWSPDTFTLPNVNGDIHSGTLRLPTPSDYPIEFQYKYLNGNSWGTEEAPGPEADCPTVSGSDRLVMVNNSGENLYDVFNGCNYSLSLQDFNQTDVKFVYDKNNRILNFFSSNLDKNISLLQVFDINGREVKRIQETNSIQNSSVNFQGLENGIYIIRFEMGNSQIIKKVSVY